MKKGEGRKRAGRKEGINERIEEGKQGQILFAFDTICQTKKLKTLPTRQRSKMRVKLHWNTKFRSVECG